MFQSIADFQITFSGGYAVYAIWCILATTIMCVVGLAKVSIRKFKKQGKHHVN